jgi:hypothetical protein
MRSWHTFLQQFQVCSAKGTPTHECEHFTEVPGMFAKQHGAFLIYAVIWVGFFFFFLFFVISWSMGLPIGLLVSMCGEADKRSVCPSCLMDQTICSRLSDNLPALYLIHRFSNADLTLHCLLFT